MGGKVYCILGSVPGPLVCSPSLTQWSPSRAILPPILPHQGRFGNVWNHFVLQPGVGGKLLLTSSGWRPVMLPNILQDCPWLPSKGLSSPGVEAIELPSILQGGPDVPGLGFGFVWCACFATEVLCHPGQPIFPLWTSSLSRARFETMDSRSHWIYTM